MQGIYLSTNNVHAIMTKKIQYLVCILLNRSTRYSGLTTNAYVVALKYGCLLVAMTKPATYVEPSLQASQLTCIGCVTHPFAQFLMVTHRAMIISHTYPLQSNSAVRSSHARHKPDHIGGPYRLEIIYVSASTKILIT